LTRSHHLATIHIATTDLIEETMVLPLKRVPPKSSSGPEPGKPKLALVPRPARTPPSTFLFLHLYLSNSPRPEGLSPLEGLEVPLDDKSQPIDYRLFDSLIGMRSFTRHQTRSWPRAKTAPRSVGRSINPPHRPCQRLMSTNRRIVRTYFAARRSCDFCAPYAVLEP
jgi:hypothetical protein